MLEIPVSTPDDMELFDGLDLTPAEVAHTWCQILIKTHLRGELFNLIFHPELAVLCEQPFYEVLNCAKSMQPQIWVARLCDISERWLEKACFRVEITQSQPACSLTLPVRQGLRSLSKESTCMTLEATGMGPTNACCPEPWRCRLFHAPLSVFRPSHLRR